MIQIAAEKNFENRLKKWLEMKGVYPLGTSKQNMTVPPCGYYEKRWGGGVYTKKGLPDLHIVVNGINIDVEVKAPNYKPTMLQLHNIDQITFSNCIGFVLYENQKDAKLCSAWIGRKYPEYKAVHVKDFDSFKNLIHELKGDEYELEQVD